MAKPKTFYIDIDLNNNALHNLVIGTFNEASGIEGAFGYDTGEFKFIDASGVQSLASQQFVLDSFANISASNGLTNDAGDLKLGGTLISDVDLIPDSNFSRNINFGNDSFRVSQFKVKSNYGEFITDGGSQSVYMGSVSDSTEKGRISVSANGATIRLVNSDNSGTLAQFEMDNSNMVISSPIGSFAGLRYDSDYSNNYTSRSLVDKEYVATAIYQAGTAGGPPPPTYTFANGLTENDGDVILGGGLTDDISIGSTSNFDEVFLNNVFNIAWSKLALIFVIKIQSDGKILLGGNLQVNGARNIVRLNANGTLDTSFNAGTGFNTGSQINTIAIQDDNKILIGGDFSSYDGESYNNIIRLNTDGSIDTSFVIGAGFNNSVSKILFLDFDYTLVGGQFTEYDSTSVGFIARLNNNDGSLDSTFQTNAGTGFDGVVNTLENQPGTGILVGGEFNNYDVTAAPKMARISADGIIDGTFSIGTGFDGVVAVIKFDSSNSSIYVGGQFDNLDGNTASRIAQLDINGAHNMTFATEITGGDVYSIDTQPNGIVLVGGDFTTVNGDPHPTIVRLNPGAGFVEEFDYTILGNPVDFQVVLYVIAPTNNTFFVGGFVLGIPGFIKYQIPVPYDFTFATGRSVKYDQDYSSLYNNRSLVDKEYVDTGIKVLGLAKPIKIASTENIDLTTGGLLEIDGIQTIAGDRILVKDQSTLSENGIYFASSGQWPRSDVDDMVLGLHVFVQEGTENANSGWLITATEPINLGSTDITFSKFAGIVPAGEVTASNGLTKTGDDIALGGTLTTNTLISGEGFNLTIGDSASRLTSLNIGLTPGNISSIEFGDVGGYLVNTMEFTDIGTNIYLQNQNAGVDYNVSHTISRGDYDFLSINASSVEAANDNLQRYMITTFSLTNGYSFVTNTSNDIDTDPFYGTLNIRTTDVSLALYKQGIDGYGTTIGIQGLDSPNANYNAIVSTYDDQDDTVRTALRIERSTNGSAATIGVGARLDYQLHLNTTGGNPQAIVGAIDVVATSVGTGTWDSKMDMYVGVNGALTKILDLTEFGAHYTSDYSSDYTDRSLVDKAFVYYAIANAGTAGVAVSKYVTTITGDGVETSFIVTHALDSYDVMVQVFQNTGSRSNVDVGVDRNSTDEVTIVFGIAPSNGVEYRVLINKIN